MIKKIITVILLCMMLALAVGCSKGKQTDTEIYHNENSNSEEVDNTDSSSENVEVIMDRLPDNVAHRIENAVRCMLVAPAEFEDVNELPDDIKIYAALLRCSSEFQPVANNEYLFTLDLDRLPMAVKAVFGPDAGLSEDFENGDYYPFEIIKDENLIYRYSETVEDNYFFTSSVKQVADDEYEIEILNLRDPIFFKEFENYLLDGNPATDNLVAPYKDQMLTYIFRLKENGNGLIITSLRIINNKDLNSFVNEDME